MKTIKVYDWIADELKTKNISVEDLLDFWNENHKLVWNENHKSVSQ